MDKQDDELEAGYARKVEESQKQIDELVSRYHKMGIMVTRPVMFAEKREIVEARIKDRLGVIAADVAAYRAKQRP